MMTVMNACDYIDKLSTYLVNSCYETLEYPSLTIPNLCNVGIKSLTTNCTITIDTSICTITITEI